MQLSATLEYLIHDGVIYHRTMNINGDVVWLDPVQDVGFTRIKYKWRVLETMEDCPEPELEKLYRQIKKEATNANL